MARAAKAGGFTIVELMLVLAMVGLLAGLSLTSYVGYVEKARVASAVAQIAALGRILDGITADDDAELPATLAEIGQADLKDPWGRPYQYLRLEGALAPGVAQNGPALPPVAAPPGGQGGGPPGGQGGAPAIALTRKDGFLVPINSDFDLYSLGKDGQSKPPLNASVSRDDVIRASDGSYIGLAVNY